MQQPPESIQETVSEHMAYTMQAAMSAKQADERRKKETAALESQRPDESEAQGIDELPSRARQVGETNYARIDSFDDNTEEQDPDLIAAITNRGQAPKQGDGQEQGPPVMDSTSKTKPSNNIDLLAMAKQMENSR